MMDWTLPPVFKNGGNYELYRKQILAWTELTDLAKNKQGIVVALSLPEDETNIKEKVFDEIPLEDLKTADGLIILLRFLDKLLGKDDLVDSFEKYDDFEKFERKPGQPINEYLSSFEWKYRKIENKSMKLPPEVLAYRLIKKANISREEKLIILSELNFENKTALYDDAKKALKKYKGIYCEENSSITNISLRPAFQLGIDRAMLCASEIAIKGGDKYSNDKRVSWKYGVSGSPHIGAWGDYNTESGSNVSKTGGRKKINPKGTDGYVLKCHSCGSFRHLLDACPDSWENMEKQSTGKEKNIESVNQGDKKKISQQDGLKKLVDSGAKQEQLKKLMYEMASLKKEIVSVKDEIKAVKRKEMKGQEERSHNLELQLGHEKQTRMRLESTTEEVQNKILQVEKNRKDIGQEAETFESGRDMGKWWNPVSRDETETRGMNWLQKTFVYDKEMFMQQTVSQLLILMQSEMLNKLRQFIWGTQLSATQITFWIKWLKCLSRK